MLTRTLLILSLLLLTACQDTYTWRQKLTVTVQTPDGEVSASSVTEVTKIQSDSFWMPIEARGVQSRIRGEAVALEVTPGRYLFVLLDGQDQLALRAFPQFTYQRDDEFRQWARSIERHRGSGKVPPEYYPMMVTFEDIDDPTSARLIDADDLVTAFGEGFDLAALNLEITDDEKTVGRVLNILDWWPELRSGPYNEMSALRLSDSSPRGWRNLGPSQFWSLDERQRIDDVTR